MKQIQYLLLLAMMVALAACHSNEANYKAAYDKAREKKNRGHRR